jgi:hypothetical protein
MFYNPIFWVIVIVIIITLLVIVSNFDLSPKRETESSYESVTNSRAYVSCIRSIEEVDATSHDDEYFSLMIDGPKENQLIPYPQPTLTKTERPDSKGEVASRAAMESIFHAKFTKARPSWLEKLELDGYNPELRLAFEYNGIQHYKYTPFFHRKGPQDLVNQIERDNRKLDICDRMGVTVITIPYTVKNEDIESFIRREYASTLALLKYH